MPIRPRSHQLDSESKAQFASVLPSLWVWRQADPDYGIDGQVELFDEYNKATGLMFLVQLKATDALDLSDALSVQFKLDTLAYYRKLDLPVMIVLWSALSRRFFWQWAHEVDTYHAERGQKYITVRLPQERVWDTKTPSMIEKDLKEFRELRRPNIRLPQIFSLITKEKEFHGISCALLQSAVIEAAKGQSDLVAFSGKDLPGAHPMVIIEEGRVTVSLSGLSSVTYHRQWFEESVKAAKITNFRWHDLRHTFASRLVMAGVDLRTVQQLMGHKTITMTLRYTHLAPEHQLGAVQKLCPSSQGQAAATDTRTGTAHEAVTVAATAKLQ
jgi:hypothetical protein